jgi:integrase
MAQALTPTFVASAVCPEGQPQIEYFDSVVPGLALRVGKAGTKAWTLFMRENGRRRRVALGSAGALSLAEARNAARQVLGGRAQPHSPSGNSQTFEALADLFLQRASSLRPASIDEYQRIVRAELLPRWRSRVVDTLTRDDVFAVLDPILARGSKVMANHVQQMIVALLNVAVDRGWIISNIARGIRRVGGKELAPERSLDIRELAKLWRAMDGEKLAVVAAVLRVLILTCCRRNEVRRMRWEELDWPNGFWTLPSERTKSKRERGIALTPTAIRIIEAQEPRSSGLVFAGVPEDLSGTMKRLCGRAGIQHCTVHDLRRSSATLIASMGTSRVVLALILGHVDNAVTARYDRHTYWKEQADARLKLDAVIQQELGLMDEEAREARQPT